MNDASANSGRRDRHVVALLGNPNTGKSSLFTALTGARQRVANYPGVTVEAKVGQTAYENTQLTVIDLPGTYSLSARSPDERVATEALLGRLEETPKPDGVIIVVDASSLERNLYLATQILEFGLPAVIVLTMVDVAATRGITVDVQKLSAAVGVPVVAVNAPARTGLDELKAVLHKALHHPAEPLKLEYPPEFERGIQALHSRMLDMGVKLGWTPLRPEALRLLADGSGPLYDEIAHAAGDGFTDEFTRLRQEACAGQSAALIEATARYGAIGRWAREARTQTPVTVRTFSDRADAVLTHKLWGTLIFAGLMAVIFLSIYSWASPLMDLIDRGFGALGDWVGGMMADGPLRGLIVEGIIGGVGAVLIFLPQILILFLFIAVLEDLGYMARAAFLMDRLMSRFGLSGKSFIPLLGSFACNIPGIMGTRVIEDRNTRLTTIFMAPFMSCSARLPVYTLMIAAFVPNDGWLNIGSESSPVFLLNLQGLVLFAMYWVGVLFAIPTALVLKRGILKSKLTPFLLELPSFKWPRPKNVALVLWDRGGSFVRRAGTIILAVAIIVWALGYFPRSEEIENAFKVELENLEGQYPDEVVAFDPEKDGDSTLGKIAAAYAAHEERQSKLEESLSGEALEAAGAKSEAELDAELEQLRSRNDYEKSKAHYEAHVGFKEKTEEIENRLRAEHLRNSALGRMGAAIEPAVKPLGWDWRIGVAAIASFPAREVVIGVMGTIFSIGEADAESETLRGTLRNAKGPDGRALFGLATGLSVMVFFALCCQCGATLAVMRRETNSWRWPIASFLYMTALAYVVALMTYQIAHALGG